MLPAINRLKKKKDFERVFKKGKWLKEDFLICRIMENKQKNSRFGIIVGKSVAKKSSLRNTIKRRLRALARTKLTKIKRGVDVVLTVCPGLEKKDFWELEEIINKIFRRAKILQREKLK